MKERMKLGQNWIKHYTLAMNPFENKFFHMSITGIKSNGDADTAK